MAKRGGGGGGRTASAGAAPAVLPSQAPVVARLPDGVQHRQLTTRWDRYNATVDAIPIGVDFTRQKSETIISFSVGNRYDRSAALTSERSAKLVAKIKEIINYRVSQAQDGEKFSAVAWTQDGRGLSRALAYANAGLSAPTRIGGGQSGVVKNGKLVPTIPPDQQRARIRNLLQISRDRRRRQRGSQST